MPEMSLFIEWRATRAGELAYFRVLRANTSRSISWRYLFRGLYAMSPLPGVLLSRRRFLFRRAAMGVELL